MSVGYAMASKIAKYESNRTSMASFWKAFVKSGIFLKDIKLARTWLGRIIGMGRHKSQEIVDYCFIMKVPNAGQS